MTDSSQTPTAPPAHASETREVTGPDVRVRFCPSPTGTPHVGLARTALFNWAYARHHGGSFVFRLEDTDASRDSEESAAGIYDMLEWLGLTPDEGVHEGGPHAPYRQSERHDLHAEVARKLVEAGYAYESFSTPEEVEERHRAAGRDPKLGYDNFDRELTDEQKEAFRAEGRQPVLRLRMPDEDITFTDMVRGEVTFPAGQIPDYVIVRGNGIPLYTLVNPVDDAAMGITHVIRGEDLLSSTPRQVALYRALIAIGEAEQVPTFGHLPLVLGNGTKKLSKRDPEADLFLHRKRGFVREGMINYLALLGWSIGPDEDIFTPEELVEAFDVHDVNPNPARWDQKKAESINGDHLRRLDLGDFTACLLPLLQDAEVLPERPSMGELARLKAVAELVQTRVPVLAEAVELVRPFFVEDSALVRDENAVAGLKEDAPQVLATATEALEAIPDTPPVVLGDPNDEAGPRWAAADIEAALRESLVEGMGIKPKFAFAPLRVALSGAKVSPPLFESMEILGKSSTLARLRSLGGQITG
ncbi:glutamyl-tRNA synthetase [Kytococcus aerolatus]|uniref:Glutamate--tRNA ligase n=1 Tax=Kytococcus aerolatus TaxID=592308 RepID=A0A212U1G7_9MICO|nr:glutamate--tRNA ligase [Kytococcus aerolatus]SNC72107.1 glutamyl-tRNA synthetase [Kytococcus aerolatus]